MFLPPYAPEFNPVEGVWCDSKSVELRGYLDETEDDLESRAERPLRRQGRQRYILKGHVKQTGRKRSTLLHATPAGLTAG